MERELTECVDPTTDRTMSGISTMELYLAPALKQ